MVDTRTRRVILALGLVALAVAPFAFTTTSWKRMLAGVAAVSLAVCWALVWWAAGDRRRFPQVALVLGVFGGLVLGGLGAGMYCQLTDCSMGFDALFLLPFGALVGAFVGGGIGYAIAYRMEHGPTRPRPPQQAGR